MNRSSVALLTVLMLCRLDLAARDEVQFELLGESLPEGLKVRWHVPSNAVPPSLRVFKVSRPTWSESFLSNLISICAFDDRKSAWKALAPALTSRDASYTEEITAPNGQRQLRKAVVMNPRRGRVFYHGEDALAPPKQAPQNVPSQTEVLQRALDVFQKLGMSTNELYRDRNTGEIYVTRDERRQWSYGQHNKQIVAHGLYLVRALDGLGIDGAGTCGGLRIRFGDHGKLHELHLFWPNIHTPRAAPRANTSTLLSWVRDGKSTVELFGDKARASQIKSLTLTNASVWYFGNADSRQSSIYPFLRIDGLADLGGIIVPARVNCPVLDD